MMVLYPGYVRWENRGMPEEKLKSTFDWSIGKHLPKDPEKLSKRFQKAVTGKAKPAPRLRKTRDSTGELQRWGDR
jgi:hypothetical protein